jgi:VIT1/CCC1 family predicted Fe2+/Mn2+ transporter
MTHDALGAHARDELGMSDMTTARPLQAAMASAATFAAGAALPMIAVLLAPPAMSGKVVSIASLICLGGLGALAGRAGGASPLIGALRVGFWGALAMGLTAAVGALFGVGIQS